MFIEFSNAYGIKEGTAINLRGIQVGYVEKVQIKINSLVVLVFIKSSDILIPRSSIVETNQTGLFNDTFIDIIPLEKIEEYDQKKITIFSKSCLNSQILCHNHYLKGNRGLNYDDLVRATTRISQRFDDPHFFNLAYLFFKNGIDISEEIIITLNNTSHIIYILTELLDSILSKYCV